MLKAKSISFENLDVFVCMQTRPWSRSLLLRPHPWLQPNAPATGNGSFANNIAVGVFDLDGVVDHLGSGSVSTHGPGNMIFSPNNLSFAKNAVTDDKKTHCFYSVCVDGPSRKAALTVHCLMNDKDFGLVQWALGKSKDIHEFIGGMRGFKNSALNGTLENEVVAWTFLDTLKSLALQEQPFCQLLTRDCRYRLVEQGGLNQTEYQKLKQQADAAQESAQKDEALVQLRQQLGKLDRLVDQLRECSQACQSEEKSAQFIAMQHGVFMSQLQKLSLTPVATFRTFPKNESKLREVHEALRNTEQLKRTMAALLAGGTKGAIDVLANAEQRVVESCSNLEKLYRELQAILDRCRLVNCENREVNQQLIQQASSHTTPTPPPASPPVSVPSSTSNTSTTDHSGQSVQQIFDERLASLQQKREASMRLLAQPGIQEAIPDHQRITLERICQTAESRLNSWGRPGKFDSLPQARADQLRGKGISAFEGLIQQLDEHSVTIRQALARHQASSTSTGPVLHQLNASGNTTTGSPGNSMGTQPTRLDHP